MRRCGSLRARAGGKSPRRPFAPRLGEPLSKTWVAFRVAERGAPAFWIDASYVGTSGQPRGRWHSPDGGVAQYWSLDPDVAWSEMVRKQAIRTEQQRKERKWTLWWATITEYGIADLSSFERIASAGLNPQWLLDDRYEYCWALTLCLQRLGYRGLLTPSAATHGEKKNLTLFGGRREAQNSKPPTSYFVPVERLRPFTTPPAGVLDSVRYQGEPHESLTKWLAE